MVHTVLKCFGSQLAQQVLDIGHDLVVEGDLVLEVRLQLLMIRKHLLVIGVQLSIVITLLRQLLLQSHDLLLPRIECLLHFQDLIHIEPSEELQLLFIDFDTCLIIGNFLL